MPVYHLLPPPLALAPLTTVLSHIKDRFHRPQDEVLSLGVYEVERNVGVPKKRWTNNVLRRGYFEKS